MDKYPMTIETFRTPGYMLRDLQRAKKPSCINSVSFRRYRVTAELIEEPAEVLKARLLDMWHASDNSHHRQPMKDAAEKLGFELPLPEFGRDRKDRQ